MTRARSAPFSLAVLATLLVGPGISAHAAPARTVLVFGDSLSAGFQMQPEESWPALLQARVVEGWRVVNASRSGETTAGGLARLPAALEKHQPAVVVLELGANDALRGTSLAIARANLGRMIELSRKAGAEVLLVAVTLPPELGASRVEPFEAMFTEVAAEHRLRAPPQLFTGFVGHPELMMSDRLHPTARAQVKLLDNVWPALKPLLAAQPKPQPLLPTKPRSAEPPRATAP